MRYIQLRSNAGSVSSKAYQSIEYACHLESSSRQSLLPQVSTMVELLLDLQCTAEHTSLSSQCPHLVNDHSNMIIHILLDIPQEARRDDADPAERNADVVHVFVALGVGEFTCFDDSVVSDVALEAGDETEGFRQGRAGEADSFGDEGGFGNVQLVHRAADVFDGVGNEFVDEHLGGR